MNQKAINRLIKLVLVTNLERVSTSVENYLAFIEQCVASGVTMVQIREKNLNKSDLVDFCVKLKSLLNKFLIPVMINDSLDLACRLNLSGVHLGQSDGCVVNARNKLGNEKIIGLSVNSLEEIQIANTLPIDYIGVGAIFPTANKRDVAKIWGCDELKKASQLSKHPIIAIGGIDHHNAHQVILSGARGVAAIGAFHHTHDPKLIIQQLVHITRQEAI